MLWPDFWSREMVTGVRDVVFFMHGILDTSMGWVANGTGSHAFAAYDQGMDVWLGSSRANPPREHIGTLTKLLSEGLKEIQSWLRLSACMRD